MKEAACLVFAATCALGCTVTGRLSGVSSVQPPPAGPVSLAPVPQCDPIALARPSTAIESKQAEPRPACTPAASAPQIAPLHAVSGLTRSAPNPPEKKIAQPASIDNEPPSATVADGGAELIPNYTVGAICSVVFTSILAPLVVEAIKNRLGAGARVGASNH